MCFQDTKGISYTVKERRQSAEDYLKYLLSVPCLSCYYLTAWLLRMLLAFVVLSWVGCSIDEAEGTWVERADKLRLCFDNSFSNWYNKDLEVEWKRVPNEGGAEHDSFHTDCFPAATATAMGMQLQWVCVVCGRWKEDVSRRQQHRRRTPSAYNGHDVRVRDEQDNSLNWRLKIMCNYSRLYPSTS